MFPFLQCNVHVALQVCNQDILLIIQPVRNKRDPLGSEIKLVDLEQDAEGVEHLVRRLVQSNYTSIDLICNLQNSLHH